MPGSCQTIVQCLNGIDRALFCYTTNIFFFFFFFFDFCRFASSFYSLNAITLFDIKETCFAFGISIERMYIVYRDNFVSFFFISTLETITH